MRFLIATAAYLLNTGDEYLVFMESCTRPGRGDGDSTSQTRMAVVSQGTHFFLVLVSSRLTNPREGQNPRSSSGLTGRGDPLMYLS